MKADSGQTYNRRAPDNSAPDMLRSRLLRYLLVIFGALAAFIIANTILLLFVLPSLPRAIGQARLLIVVTTIFLLALIVISAVLFSRLITGRLNRLIAAMEELKQGAYPRLVVSGDDEFSDLTRGFNQMVEELRTRDEKLKNWTGRRETELARLSQTLEVERGKLETVLQTIGDGVIVLDNENKVLMANRRVGDVFGIAPEGIVGTDLENLISRVKHRLVNPEVVDRQFRELQRNTGTVDELVMQLAEGPEIHLYCAPVRGSNGRLFGRIARSLDLSREHELERMKTEFISTISHELRTPLTSIKGALGLVRSGAAGPVSPDLRELLDIAVTNTDRLVTTINDMLDMGQLEHGRIQMDTMPLAVRSSVDLAIAAVKRQAEQRRVSLEVHIPSGLPAMMADPKRIEQVLINLLSNAIKFSSPEGRVVVAAGEQQESVVVSVRDFGVGISKEFQERMFRKFEHQEGALTRSSQGPGLGLAISKRIIDAHGGRIWVDSEEGKGSTFYFCVPAAKQATPGVPDGSRSPAQRGRSSLVLVVEDDEDVAKVIAFAFESDGHKVIRCHNGREALQLVRSHRPDILTLDLNVPGLNGLEVLQQLRGDEQTKRVPVICISAHPDPKPALAQGANFYLEKPLDMDKLRQISQQAFAAGMGGAG